MPETSSNFGTRLSYDDAAVSLSEVISAMTFALDMTEGAVPGHGLRSCVIGMRIADALNVPVPMRTSLYYALQLKDVGCSSNAARVSQIVGGDDRTMKAATKISDWDKPLQTMRQLWPNVMPGRNVLLRAARFVQMGFARERNNRETIELRCERGAEIVRMLEMGDLAAEAVRRLDEQWDGKGLPGSLRGNQIPLLARICAVAQNLDVFAMEMGIDTAIQVLKKRSGTFFDPSIVRVAVILHDAGILWKNCRAGDNLDQTRAAVLTLDPGMKTHLTPERIDKICEAFATVVDTKSPFTFRHSKGVAAVAVELAEEMNLPPARVQMVRRAALLHDIGKLNVSNAILDKDGPLTDEEREAVSAHPTMSRSILERVTAFRELAVIAGEHHERLDGTGYPQGLHAESLSLESRLIAMADSYSALAEERPYREAIAPAEIVEMLRKHVPAKLDARCFEALQAIVVRQGSAEPMGAWTAPVVEKWATVKHAAAAA